MSMLHRRSPVRGVTPRSSFCRTTGIFAPFPTSPGCAASATGGTDESTPCFRVVRVLSR